jgi:autotransporter family porin
VVQRGGTVTLTATVTSRTTRRALVDLEVYAGTSKRYQRYWDSQAFTAGKPRTFIATWTVPANETLGTHNVKIGVFKPRWASLLHWNNDAASFDVRQAGGTTATTTAPPTTQPPAPTTTAPAPTTTAPAPTTTAAPPPGGRFGMLPVGAALPSDAECAARVRRSGEIRSANTTFNQTVGTNAPMSGPYYGRVTGNFRGTTDEIIQWASCKWGIDEDYVRAQAALESWWYQRNVGDFTSDPARCAPGHPIGADGRPGECPESVGIMQVRYPYWSPGFPSAGTSTAYNLDYALAARRSCFEGAETWLNQFERGRDYAAGDIWGCMGLWFSGRWYTPESVTYMNRVQGYLADRIWETPGFRAG